MRKLILLFGLLFIITTSFRSHNPHIGTVIDILNGVEIYFNGPFQHVEGRHITADGYNLGLKYQCVEFIKRYYYERFDHRMPNTYGHAADFYDKMQINEVAYNSKRGLYQYRNGSTSRPKLESILVLDRTDYNPYGHIGIVSNITDTHIEIAQQNYGIETRRTFPLAYIKGRYFVYDNEVLGWLSMN